MNDAAPTIGRERRDHAVRALAAITSTGDATPLQFFDGRHPRSEPDHVTVTEDVENRYFEILVNSTYAGILVYEVAGNRRLLTHTFIQEEFRGRGLVTKLLHDALLDLERSGHTITSYCPIVNEFLRNHPEFQHLIDLDHPGTVTRGV